MFAELRTVLVPAALAALVALPAAAQPGLEPIEVPGKAPITVRVSLKDKAPPVVRREIWDAARHVCRNAVRNEQLDLGDYDGCRDRTSAEARRTYAGIMARQAPGPAPAITLSVR